MSNSLGPHGLYARQDPPSMELPRREYWDGLPFPFPEDIHDPGMETASPALAGIWQILYH